MLNEFVLGVSAAATIAVALWPIEETSGSDTLNNLGLATSIIIAAVLIAMRQFHMASLLVPATWYLIRVRNF